MVESNTGQGRLHRGPRCLVMGVGGGGCNAVAHAAAEWGDGPELIGVHTDAQALHACAGIRPVQIGASVLHGVSTAGDTSLGKRAVEVDTRMLSEMLEEIDLLFLVVGLGGGTGGGAAPAIAKLARNQGTMTLAFASLPFEFEGAKRNVQARDSLTNLRQSADAVIVMPNDRLFTFIENNTSMTGAFQKADATIGMSIRSIWSLLTQVGIMNVNFADLRGLLSESGSLCTMACIETGGQDRARAAVKAVLNDPVFASGNVIARASGMLVGIMGGDDVTLVEVQDVMKGINAVAAPDAHVLMGTAVDAARRGTLVLTVVATETMESVTAAKEELAVPRAPAPPPLRKPVTPPPKRTRGRRKAEQTKLNLDSGGKGRFKDVQPTIYDGEDLDIPTFVRRGVRLSKDG